MTGCKPQAKKRAFVAFVRPHVKYRATVWNPWLKKDIDALEKIQKRAARWICCHWSKQNYSWLPSYEEACTQLRWHSLATRRTILTCCQVFKIIHKQDSLNLSIYPQLGHMISHCFVPHPTLDIPFLLIAHIYVWITLPSTIAHAQTLCNFKTNIFNHFSITS